MATNLETRQNDVDLNNQMKNDLNLIGSKASLNATESALFRNEIKKVEIEVKSMEESKNGVDAVLSELESLVQMETKLREPSEYRELLINNKLILSGYSEEIGKEINRYNEKLEEVKSNHMAESGLYVKGAQENAKKFKKYAEEAKEIEGKLKNMEREIKGLVRDQETNDRLDKISNEKQSQIDSQQAEIDRLNQELAEANARADAESQARKQAETNAKREKDRANELRELAPLYALTEDDIKNFQKQKNMLITGKFEKEWLQKLTNEEIADMSKYFSPALNAALKYVGLGLKEYLIKYHCA